MPNHVINEVIFRNLSDTQIVDILSRTTDAEGHIDFSILLPIPINCWMGYVSIADEKAFKNTALDWCRENWGTKWGAYGPHNGAERVGSVLTLRFDSAWRPPYGWLAALMNTFNLSFQHNWLSEGEPHGHVGHFIHQPGNVMGDVDWKEEQASSEIHTHLHVLRWGVERFDEIEE